MSSYGYERKTTPSIDELASRSTVFERAYSHAASTAPALSSLMTSKYVHQHGVLETYKYALAEEELTLAERLVSAGFRTAAFTGVGVLMPNRNLDQGFQHYSFAQYTNRQYWKTAPEVANEALQWLQENQESRFFLWAHFFEPHQPYDIVPPEWLERFSAAPSTHALLQKHNPDSSAYARIKRRIDHYDGALAYSDFHVGRLLEGLNDLHLADATMVVISADHGEGLGEHGLHGHAYQLYEPLIRIPLIIHVPGRQPARFRGLVEHIDVLPTVMAALGLPQDPSLQGRDLTASPAWDAEADSRSAHFESRAAFSETWLGGKRKSALIDGQWKLILTQDPGTEDVLELYDLAQDPHELDDISDRRPELRDRLQPELNERKKAAFLKPRLLRQDPEEIEMLRALGYLR